MARTIPTVEPESFIAGDSVEFDIAEHSDYPIADGWSLTYAFRGPSALDLATDEITETGTTYEVRIPSARTRTLAAGDYAWAARVSDGTDTFTIRTGRLVVQAALAMSAPGETTDETELRLVNAAIEDILTAGVASYQINGRAANKLDLTDLYRKKAILESRIDCQRSGTPFRAVSRVAFVAPR